MSAEIGLKSAAKPGVFAPSKMTFSGLVRHVSIVEGVRNSDALLSAADRHNLTCDLLDAPGNPTVEEIEAACQSLADANLEHNMVSSQIIRSSQRGY